MRGTGSIDSLFSENIPKERSASQKLEIKRCKVDDAYFVIFLRNLNFDEIQ